MSTHTTPNLRLSQRIMALKRSLIQSRLNMSSQKVGPIDLNIDHPESKLSSTAAVSPSSDLETHKRGKRYILYRFLNVLNESNEREISSSAITSSSELLVGALRHTKRYVPMHFFSIQTNSESNGNIYSHVLYVIHRSTTYHYSID